MEKRWKKTHGIGQTPCFNDFIRAVFQFIIDPIRAEMIFYSKKTRAGICGNQAGNCGNQAGNGEEPNLDDTISGFYDENKIILSKKTNLLFLVFLPHPRLCFGICLCFGWVKHVRMILAILAKGYKHELRKPDTFLWDPCKRVVFGPGAGHVVSEWPITWRDGGRTRKTFRPSAFEENISKPQTVCIFCGLVFWFVLPAYVVMWCRFVLRDNTIYKRFLPIPNTQLRPSERNT